MSRNKKEIIEISGLSEISDKYNAFLIDLWGVVHNGINLFPDILYLLKKLKDQNKQIRELNYELRLENQQLKL